MTEKRILYFADPMCSWCWGFSPVIHEIARRFSDRLGVQIHTGGLRAGNTRVMDKDQRMQILNHWFSVNEASGQPFDFSFRMPEGFVYDTEPACRAVKTMQALNPERDLDYFSAIQRAFYTGNEDVTRLNVLSNLAVEQGSHKTEFEQLFDTDEIRQRTRDDFILTARLGVNGFPTLIGQNADGYVYLSQGFQLYDPLQKRIEAWLN